MDTHEYKQMVVVDIRMPFWSMVTFMVKWAIAAIPAIIIPGEGADHTNHLRPKGRSGGATSVSLVAPMKKRYDFAKSVRNPDLRQAKKQLTIRLDEDAIDYFRALAEKNGVPYQNLINLYLRDGAQSDRKLTMKWN